MSRKSKKYKFNPDKPIWVRRVQPRVCERGVQFWQPGREHHVFWSNPVESAVWLTGKLGFNRTGCIVSYLDGLVAAGFKVVVFDNQTIGVGHPHHNASPSIPLYWLMGYLKGRNELGLFRDWLWRFKLEHRLMICEAVARHFMNNVGRGLESLHEVKMPLYTFALSR